MDVTQIVIMVIGLCVALCTAVVIPTLRNKYGQDKIDKIDKALATIDKALATIEIYKSIAEIAVKAAEQMGLTMGWDGQKKLQEAMDYAEKKLADMGIVYDETALRKEIEAAVYAICGALKGNTKAKTTEHVTSGYIQTGMNSSADVPTPTVTTTATSK